ncbi:Hypothetical protein NCS54_01232100 [Fusarium falciforme]|uniref:Hypothetical protein n=1 Tax=Fusarium falciforme TaxID=195108 RepID=UPI002301158C|nr:Hypothetical protein NCS54_01232100 [Fusarium falciforme]WAO94724.1 Hypothetical protein NCS54_01232100 [Fusarium falciforme]
MFDQISSLPQDYWILGGILCFLLPCLAYPCYTRWKQHAPKSSPEFSGKASPGKPRPGSVAFDLATAYPPPRRQFMNPNIGSATITDRSQLTATGFSKADIDVLGDFPDYAALSGVRLPHSYPEFDIDKAKARPYRPVRWVYHQTMSLQKLEPDWWIELESSYARRIEQRRRIVAAHGDFVMNALEGSEHACKELMEIVLQFLTARYPQYFSLDVANMTFNNRILGTTTDLREKQPLQVLLENVPEDFAMVLRDPATGVYHFRAGIACTSQGWSVGTKIGQDLREMHGPVPDYQKQMAVSMDRFFAKMPTDKPIERGSWALPRGETYFVLPGAGYNPNPVEEDPTVKEDECHMRVDWQTLRRLPVSGAIVFNFKAMFYPVSDLRGDPYIPSLLLKNLKEGKQNLIEHKRLGETRHVVQPLLERYEREQIEEGLIEKDWEVETLAEHPFFPGWEKRWHEAQGF